MITQEIQTTETNKIFILLPNGEEVFIKINEDSTMRISYENQSLSILPLGENAIKITGI